MKYRMMSLACLVLLCALVAPSHAHLGAQSRNKATHIHDLVKGYEAEAVVAQKDRVQADAIAGGGKSVNATPGTRFTLTTPALKRGMYAFYVSGRMAEEFLSRDKDGPAVLFRFTINSGPNGADETYDGIHAIYNETWQYVQELYFHADAEQRAYRATIEIQPDSPGEIVIDRIELRDALSGVELGAYKTSRNLLSEEEVARIAEQGQTEKIRYRHHAPRGPLTREERRKRDAELVARVPRLNSVSTENFAKRFNEASTRHYHQLQQDFQEFLGGAHYRSGAEEYLLHRNETVARDAAFMLALSAYNWPGYNFRLVHIHRDKNNKVQRLGQFKRQWGKLHIYRGWTGPMIRGMLRSYDLLFPYIHNNEELAEAIGRHVPWVESPRDVVALLDSFMVQQSWRDFQRHQGASPIELVAAVLGPCDLSERLLGQYSRFREELVSGRSRDGLSYIGSTYYAAGSAAHPFETAALLARYVAAGGDPKWDIADPERFPRLVTVFDTILGLSVSGGMRNNTGDLGGPHQKGHRITHATVRDPDDFYFTGWQRTRDPRYAWLLENEVGIPEDAEADQRAALKADAATTGDPLLKQPSRVQGGFGIAVMEGGRDTPDPMYKRTAVIRTGVASGHAQSDSLNLALFAFGCRMAPDIGGRARGEYGRPSSHLTRQHNAVEVDRRPMGGTAINATGTAWVDTFKPIEGAQVTEASAYMESHPEVSLYNRTTALIDVSAGDLEQGILPSAYVVDVFRVRGGDTHTYCFHGAVSDEFTTNAGLTEATDPEVLAYLNGHRPGTFLQGTSTDTLEAVWRLRRTPGSFEARGKEYILNNVEADFLGDRFDPNGPPKYTRLTLFGHGGETVMSGHAYCFQARKYSWPLLFVQRKAAESVYPALIEMSAGESVVASKKILHVTPAGEGAEAAVAMEIVTKDLPHEPAHRDIIVQAPYADEAAERTVAGGVTTDGAFAYVSTDKAGLRMAQLIGGTTLKAEGLSVSVGRPRHRATITAVDYAKQELTLDGEWPVERLAGERMRLGNDTHRCDYTIAGGRVVGGKTVLRWKKSAATWQGVLADVVPEKGYVTPETEPELFNYHPKYYDGMTAVSETGATWKVDVERGDRWMFLGFPVAAAHQTRISWEDLPDADGDGKRELRMVTSGRSRDWKRLPDGSVETVEAGTHMLDLEVTRIGEDGKQFWYKQHPMVFLDSLKVPHRGWPYHEQVLTNETGTKQWLSVLPEDDTRVFLNGAEVTDAKLADADNDGKRSLTFYDFGVGDTAELPTHVVIRRGDDGRYTVTANIPGVKTDIKETR